ncbi:MAG: CPBP family intramembrane glutamic endopeptidase, partial [Candidatus Binatia bacterium]
LALVLGALFGVPAAATLRWDVGALLTGVAATAPMLAVFAVFMLVDLAPLRTIREILDRFVGMVFARATWLHIAVVSLAAGLGEELLFRGFLQGGLEQLIGVVPAATLASIAFGLAHAVTPTYVVIATAFGAYFGWLWLATGNLLTVVVAHAVYDFVALTVMIRARRRRLPDVRGPIAT